MDYQQDTEPEGLPLTLPEVREHLKLPNPDEEYYEDTLILTLMGGAANHAESVTRRALMSRDFLMFLDRFPNSVVIEIPKPRLTAVTHIKYYDLDDSQQTLANTKYHVDTNKEPGRVVLKTGEIWPLTETRHPSCIEIKFTAGYTDRDAIPPALRTAMLLMIGHWFENREAVVVGPTGLRVNEVPLSVDLLLDQSKVMSFF